MSLQFIATIETFLADRASEIIDQVVFSHMPTKVCMALGGFGAAVGTPEQAINIGNHVLPVVLFTLAHGSFHLQVLSLLTLLCPLSGIIDRSRPSNR